MALVKCYDPEGKEHQKESVDVRECVAHCGFTLNPPEAKVEVVVNKPVAEVKSAHEATEALAPAWTPKSK